MDNYKKRWVQAITFFTMPAMGMLSANSSFAADKNQIYTEIYNNTFSDIAPIDQFFDDLRGPKVAEGEFVFTTTTAALGQKIHVNDNFGGISYELFTRLDYYLEFTPDTAELFWADKNDQPLDRDKSYDVNLEANHVKAHGLKLGYLGFYEKHFEYQIHLSYLYAYEMLVGQLSGDLNGLGSDAEGDLLLNYHYSEDKFFKREPRGLSAKGLVMDFGFNWKLNHLWELNFKSTDLFSRIFWNDQDFTTARASSERVRFDDDGLLEVDPALSWLETETNLRQRLPVQLDLRERLHVSTRDSFELRQYAYDSHLFHRIAYRHRFFSQIFAGLSYDFSSQAKGLDLQTRYFRLRVETNDFDTKLAEHISFTLGFYIPY